MSRWSKLRWPILILAIIFVAATSMGLRAEVRATHVPPRASFTLTISAARVSVKSGSIVSINVVIKNLSGHNIVLQSMYIRPYVETTDHATVVYSSGGEARQTEMGKNASYYTANTVFWHIQKGESFNYSLNVTDLYDFSRPGKYKIQIERLDPDTKTVVKSNTIEVTVTP